jgi:hypothetical protein
MLARRFLFVVSIWSVFVLWGAADAGPLFPVERELWKPITDDVYLQEIARKVKTDAPVVSVAAYDSTCYAVIDGNVHVLGGDAFGPAPSAPSGVRALEAHDGALWALADTGLFQFRSGGWEKLDDRVYVDLCMHLGVLHAATRDEVFRLLDDRLVSVKPEGGYLSSDKTNLMADGTQVLLDPVRMGPIQRIVSYSGTLYVLRPGELVLFDGLAVDDYALDWGALPSPRTRDMLAPDARLLITTSKGLAVVRGAAMTVLKGEDGLPYEDTTCLAQGFDGDVWIGTTKGAIRMLKDEWHYFGAHHWLPGDNVHDIAVDGKDVYIATDHGIGVIHYEPYTLRKKADYYERWLDEWGHKRLGFIHTLTWHDGLGWVREVSDNDGGHTTPYLAAMSFKYAATGEKAAREAAVDSFKAMIWLDEITPKDGLIARSIWSTVGDLNKRGRGGSGGLPAKWYPTDDGDWYWKGDTSSDEVDGHFYSVSIFHDLAAKGAEKARAKAHLARIATHIMDNGWVLRDMDGKPTRWGRWDPDYLFRPYGMYARGLNGMSAQNYMRTAYALTGDSRFEEGFQQLIDWGYHTYTVQQRITFPPSDIAPWDDELAFRTYYTLLRYTDDPYLRSIYLRGLARSWEAKRMQHVGWFNFTYSAVTGNDGEIKEAVRDLREWPLDCIEHTFENSHRDDLATRPGYVVYGVGTRGMSPRETSVKRGSRDALPYDGGFGGLRIMEPTGFLRDYWMGRYHGFIEAPTTKNRDLLRVERGPGIQRGAAPYEGPGRPDDLLDLGKS